MSLQRYGIKVQHESRVDISSHDIREWIETLLKGRVQRYVGFTGEICGGYTYGEIITGCLVIEDEKQFDADDISKYIKVFHEKWKVIEVIKR